MPWRQPQQWHPMKRIHKGLFSLQPGSYCEQLYKDRTAGPDSWSLCSR